MCIRDRCIADTPSMPPDKRDSLAISFCNLAFMVAIEAVSYTHLDVYKRQELPWGIVLFPIIFLATIPATTPKANPPICAHQATPLCCAWDAAEPSEKKPLINCCTIQMPRKSTAGI